jgi:diguanylate cyclase (GGDEF)-like protein
MAAHVIKSGEVFHLEDYRVWPERIQAPFFNEISTVVQAPLTVDEKTIGVIGMAAFDKRVPIDTEKLPLLDEFAKVASIALKNALLHQDAVALAYHDILTGLPNRAGLIVRLENEMKRAQLGEICGAVMFIDLDDLKMVNDNFGHSFGDTVIVTAGRYITEALGPDTFVARIGGDEFVVILSGERSREKAAEIAEKLIRLLSQDYAVSGDRVHLSASLGVALYPEDGDNVEEILKKADNAMYAAKNTGKDCWRFYETHIGDESYARMALTNSLRRALDRNELSLHFQPQVSCGRRQIVGFEALLRWNSPEHGCVPPARFIPFAEQSSLINTIGHHVLAEACRFIHELKRSGYPHLRVAVNVSPRQLAAEDFVEVVRQCIIEHGIEANQLELEVTENVFIESMEDSIQKLRALKHMGVFLALDDFGTGYSSLTYLRQLPAHTLKIDKTFIDKILGEASQERFIQYIIEMAHFLKMQVVAEGVEEILQVTKLEELGCDIIQGFVYSRPVCRDDAMQLLDKPIGLSKGGHPPFDE